MFLIDTAILARLIYVGPHARSQASLRKWMRQIALSALVHGAKQAVIAYLSLMVEITILRSLMLTLEGTINGRKKHVNAATC